MPNARVHDPTLSHTTDLTDLAITLGWEGCATLIALAFILLLRSPRMRRTLARAWKAIGRQLRIIALIRMGASRKLARRLQRESWDAMCAHRGLTGLLRGKVRRTAYGIAIHVRMSGALTAEAVSSKMNQIETGLGVTRGSLRLIPGRKADRAVIAITLRNPLDAALTWPGHPSRDISKPVLLGRDETGDVIRVNARQRFVIAGTSGAGKSVFLRILGAAAVVSHNARLSYVDLKAVEASLWQTIPGVDVATTPDQVRAMVNRIADRMRTRLQAMAARGDVDHTPTKVEPAEIIIVDEGAELKRAGLDDVVTQLESLAQLGRAADFWLVWASQYPTDKSGGLPIGIGTQAEAVTGLRVETPRINRNVFGEDAGGSGWEADKLPGGGGWFLLRDPQHTQAERSRAYLLEPQDVRALAPTKQVGRIPQVISPIPPMPTYAPTVSAPATDANASVAMSASPRRETPVTVAEEIWLCLAMSPAPIGNNEIARQTGRSKGAVSKTVAKMIDAGEVTASPDKKYSLVLATADQADPKKGTEA